MRKNSSPFHQLFLLMPILLSFLFIETSCSKKEALTTTTSAVKETQTSHLTNDLLKLYEKNVASFIPIKPQNLHSLLDKNKEKDVFVYFGRATCPYCRSFAAILHKTAPQDMKIYYINTENTDTNKALQEVRNSYRVDAVPSFIKFKETTVTKFDVKQGDLASFLNDL